MVRLFQAILIVVIIVAATFLPYCQGGFDPLAEPLASIAWMVGRVGILLMPVGLLWLIVPRSDDSANGRRFWLLWVTRATCFVVALTMVAIALAFGPLLAVTIAIMAGRFGLSLGRRLPLTGPVGWQVPSMLILAPGLVWTVQSLAIESIARHARDRVIANSAPLIAQIEAYHDRQGRYPVSIFALYGDVKPGAIGVQRYYYEPSGDAFNLIFEEPSLAFGVRRFAVYNPRDTQRLTVHETDRLLLDDAGLDADNAGYTFVEPLPQLHWKRFVFRS